MRLFLGNREKKLCNARLYTIFINGFQKEGEGRGGGV